MNTSEAITVSDGALLELVPGPLTAPVTIGAPKVVQGPPATPQDLPDSDWLLDLLDLTEKVLVLLLAKFLADLIQILLNWLAAL